MLTAPQLSCQTQITGLFHCVQPYLSFLILPISLQTIFGVQPFPLGSGQNPSNCNCDKAGHVSTFCLCSSSWFISSISARSNTQRCIASCQYADHHPLAWASFEIPAAGADPSPAAPSGIGPPKRAARSFSTSSRSSLMSLSLGDSLTTALFLICFALSAYLRGGGLRKILIQYNMTLFSDQINHWAELTWE